MPSAATAASRPARTPDGPGAGGTFEVREVAAVDTHDLRRRVLRGGAADAEVRFPDDDRPEAFHLAAVDPAGTVVAVSTWAPVPTERRPGRVAWRLRGMAVEPSLQGSGVGAMLLRAAEERLLALGVEVLWADGRDTALSFYERHGWVVEGEGYVTAIGLPHHTVVRELVGPGPEAQ